MKYIIICLLMFCSIATAEPRIKMVGLDYTVIDAGIRPISISLSSWTDHKYGTVPALVGSMCLISLSDILRFEVGVAFTSQDKLDVAMITGLSVPISDYLILGAWYAPFWNLYLSDKSDDPLGIMLGYTF